jgi:hypothetical protein
MHDKLPWFFTLAVFSGLSMNLILRFGIGLQRIALGEDSGDSGENAKLAFFVRPGIYFISIMILWLFFSFLQSVLFLGFLEYILVFPVSSLFLTVIEYLARRLVFTTDWRGEIVSCNRYISGYLFIGGLKADGDQSPSAGDVSPNGAFAGAPVGGALAGGAPLGAALFITLGLAGSFTQAVMLSFGFSAGAALAVLIIGEIRRRSAMEAVPACLRGGPLVLAAMGLLSLVFISVATVFYAVLGAN